MQSTWFWVVWGAKIDAILMMKLFVNLVTQSGLAITNFIKFLMKPPTKFFGFIGFLLWEPK